MKKMMILAMTFALMMSCNNADDSKDKAPEISVPTSTDTSSSMGDTSSYERMPNSIDTTRKQ